MRLVLQPVKGHEAIVARLFALQLAIGYDLHALGYVADDLAGEALIGVIVAGEPEAMLLRLALAPNLRVACFVAHFRRAEIQAVIGLHGRIGDGDRGFCVRCNRLGKGDDKFVFRDLMFRDLRTLRRDGGDLQIHCIEFQFLQRQGDRLEA